jgi:hypothetical protein
VTHEITLGWKGSVSFLHATGQGGLTLTPNTKEDTLLYPRIFSFQSTRFLGREGMNIKLYEVGILKGIGHVISCNPFFETVDFKLSLSMKAQIF